MPTVRMWAQSGPTPSPPPRGSDPATKLRAKGTGGKKTPTAPKKKRPLWFRIIKWVAIVIFANLLISVATVAFVFWMYGRDKNLPDPKSLSDVKHRQVTWIVDRNDHRIGVLYGEPKVCEPPKGKASSMEDSLRKTACEANSDCAEGWTCQKAEHETRTFVPYEKIPKVLVDALVATEDAKYWEHGGVDYWGMFRAFWRNVISGSRKEGASTITQQVVKNLLLSSEKTFKRKIQEIILARRLEQVLTKEEIITLYLNQVNFGNARYGVQEASHFYFGKDVWQLDTGQAALLAGLPQSPERYAPNKKKNWEAAKDRQIHVLNRLVETGKLAAVDADKWKKAKIQYVEEPYPELNSAPEWIGLVRNEMVKQKCNGKSTCPEGEAYLDTLGATVRTTLDPRLQETAQHALQNGLRAVDKRHSWGRPKRHAKSVDDEIKKLAKTFPKTGLAHGETYDAVVTAVHDDDKELAVDLGDYQAGISVDDDRYGVDDDGKPLVPSSRFKPGDVVEVIGASDKKPPKHAKHRVQFAKGPEGAVVILEVQSRKVRALVGGYATKTLGINRATDAHRQPGSSFKPYVYGAGIELGADKQKDQGGRITFTPASVIPDSPDPKWEDRWNAKNYESGNFSGYVRMRMALAKSLNTVSIRILERTGPDRIIDFAQRAGIDSKLPTTLSLALGSGEVTPLEHVNALATLAAGGKAGKPIFIDAIDGKATPPGETTQVIKPEVAYVVTSMMQSVVTEGTGSIAAKLRIPIAGKTGTSNEAKDVWFVGLTPDYAIGIWIGHDEPVSMGRETGGGTCVPIYVEIAKAMELPNKPFPRPPHVVDQRIDKDSGKKAPEGWPGDKSMSEVFVDGTVPTETASDEGNDVKGEYK